MGRVPDGLQGFKTLDRLSCFVGFTAGSLLLSFPSSSGFPSLSQTHPAQDTRCKSPLTITHTPVSWDAASERGVRANTGQGGALVPAWQWSPRMKEAAWLIKISLTIRTVATSVCLSPRNGAECLTAIISRRLVKLALPCPLSAGEKLGGESSSTAPEQDVGSLGSRLLCSLV